MADEKQPLQYTTMMFVGKAFARKFENEDGTVTKSYKYMFKQRDDQEFAINFWGYDTTKGADKLEEGERYTIGYIEKPNPKGDKPIKSARFFGEPREDAPATSSAPQATVISDADVKAFEEEYDAAGIEDDCRETFILTWFANKHENEYNLLHAHCVERYK